MFLYSFTVYGYDGGAVQYLAHEKKFTREEFLQIVNEAIRITSIDALIESVNYPREPHEMPYCHLSHHNAVEYMIESMDFKDATPVPLVEVSYPEYFDFINNGKSLHDPEENDLLDYVTPTALSVFPQEERDKVMEAYGKQYPNAIN